MLLNKAPAALPASPLAKPPLEELAKPTLRQSSQNCEQPPRTSPRTAAAGQASVDELLTLTAIEATALDGDLSGSVAGELLQPQSATGTGTGPKKAPPPVPPKPTAASAHTPENQTRLRYLQMAGEALLNVVQANAGLELQFIGHFKLFFTLFTVVPDGFAKPDLFSLNAVLQQGANKSASETPAPSPLAVICSKLLQNASELLHAVISNQDCVNDIAASRVMHHLLLAIELFPSGNERLLDCLHALCSNTQIIKELVYKGT